MRTISLSFAFVCLSTVLLAGPMDVRRDAVDGRAVATMNDNFRRLEQDKLSKQQVSKMIASGDISSPSGFRNLIINGDMQIDQRNNGAAVTVSTSGPVYTVDRFFGSAGGAAVTAQRVTSGITGFYHALRLTGGAGNTGVDIGQRVESLNIRHANGQNITFSAYVAASNLSSVEVRFEHPTASDDYTTTTKVCTSTVNIASTLNRVSLTCPAVTITNGLQIILRSNSALGAGETFTTTGWQLELGDTATAFEVRPRQVELAQCQRYWKSEGTGASGLAVDTDEIAIGGTHPVQMRAIPTITLLDTNIAVRVNGSSTVGSSGTTILDSGANTMGWWIRLDGYSGLSAGDSAVHMYDNGAIAFDAEL